MPNPDDIQLPNSGFKTNIGLSDALYEGSFYIRIVSRIDKIIAGLYNLDARYVPTYIDINAQIVTLDPKKSDHAGDA